MRRAAEAAADAMIAANGLVDGPESCYLPGGDCAMAKRDALALTEAVAQAAEEADPATQSCYLPGGSCSREERAALDTAENAIKATTTSDKLKRKPYLTHRSYDESQYADLH